MTDSFDECLINLPSETETAAGRYDKLLEAGMATRFVKGTSATQADVPSGGQLAWL
jgi:hypothetical protein